MLAPTRVTKQDPIGDISVTKAHPSSDDASHSTTARLPSVPPAADPRIAEANAAVRLRLQFADTEDFEDARRGWIGSLSDGVIRSTSGRVVWDANAYAFLDADCPETVNPGASGVRLS